MLAPRLNLLAAMVLLSINEAMPQRCGFDILKDDEVVGRIAASRTITGERTSYVMTSYSVLDLVWEQRVSTAMMAEYSGDSLRACMSSVHVNGSVRDSSRMTPTAGGLHCYIHPRRVFQRAVGHPWTTARMYYEEPVGQSHIFVESVLEPCGIEASGQGNYWLTFPNGARNRYVYRDGRLEEVHVDRTFLDLVFKRTAD